MENESAEKYSQGRIVDPLCLDKTDNLIFEPSLNRELWNGIETLSTDTNLLTRNLMGSVDQHLNYSHVIQGSHVFNE